MKIALLLSIACLIAFSVECQTWQSSSNGGIYYNSGNVAIGTNNTLTGRLSVATAGQNDGVWVASPTSNVAMLTNMVQGGWNQITQGKDNLILWRGAFADDPNNGGLVFAPWSSSIIGLRIAPNGNVSIGTSNAYNYQLAVNGSAIFTKAVVKSHDSWPDYVFHPAYRLPSLDSVGRYIEANHHLAEVPTADSVAKSGLDLGGNQAVLLKKIEELTLYLIEQDKNRQEQDRVLKAQEERIRRLEELVGGKGRNNK